jgi:hypothetical protein
MPKGLPSHNELLHHRSIADSMESRRPRAILVEPDEATCASCRPALRARRVMVPFQGDEVLSVILSKVLSSAADDKITDPAILLQLERWA